MKFGRGPYLKDPLTGLLNLILENDEIKYVNNSFLRSTQIMNIVEIYFLSHSRSFRPIEGPGPQIEKS